jgi:hypothetical protein
MTFPKVPCRVDASGLDEFIQMDGDIYFLIEFSFKRLEQLFCVKNNATVPILFAFLLWCAAGCAGGNVNPSTPRANTGYVDFRAESSEPLSWQVARMDDQTNNFTVIYSELSPPPDGILRLAFTPGHYQFQITFLNRVVTGPGSVEVTVIDGKITPVQVTLVPSGTTPVQRQEHSVGRTIKGYSARKNESINDESVTYQISALASAPLPYRPR